MSNSQEIKRIGMRQFSTGHFVPHSAYLSDEEFSQVLDNFVLGFVYYVLITQDKRLVKMLVAKRTIEPWSDWWLPGGRMMPGESFEETAIRHLSRQFGLSIDDRSRFQYLGTYSFVWEKRGFPPTGHGCHIISPVLILKVDNREAKAIKLLSEEHSEFAWARPEILADQVGLHPGLSQCIRELIDFLELKKSG